MKQENKEIVEKKYDKFAIASFVLSLISLFIFIFFAMMSSSLIKLLFRELLSPFSILIIFFIFNFIPITLGLIAIRRIKKTEKKGKNLAILGISISTLIFVLCGIIFNLLSGIA